MQSRGSNHNAMTLAQRRLYGELAATRRGHTLRDHSRIAVEALVAGAATRKQAESLVRESLRNLREQGVTAPSSIPWH
jgi:hypothetical protein